jgi:hypothetical protein
MNTPEKIVQAYLRLNGFFTIPYFSVLSKRCSHIDFLAVRLGGSEERIGIKGNLTSLDIDEEFLQLLGVSKRDTIGLVIEVKGGKSEHVAISDENFQYAKPFFGKLVKIFRVGFKRDLTKLCKQRLSGSIYYLVPLSHCVELIDKRFKEVKKIDQALRGRGILSKEGSWHLSEEFLSDLIYLRSLGSFGSQE